MQDKIFHLVSEVITVRVGRNSTIHRESLLKEDLALTSMELVICITHIISELQLNILDFTDYELIRLKSIGDLIDLLASKKCLTHQNEN